MPKVPTIIKRLLEHAHTTTGDLSNCQLDIYKFHDTPNPPDDLYERCAILGIGLCLEDNGKKLITSRRCEALKKFVDSTFDGRKVIPDDAKEFLKDRESDIAWRIEDFEELHGLFVSVFGREPKE